MGMKLSQEFVNDCGELPTKLKDIGEGEGDAPHLWNKEKLLNIYGGIYVALHAQG